MTSTRDETLTDIDDLARALTQALDGRSAPSTVLGRQERLPLPEVPTTIDRRTVADALAVIDEIGWHASLAYQASAEPGCPPASSGPSGVAS